MRKARKALGRTSSPDAIRSAVQPFEKMRAVDAVADLTRLMVEFPEAGPTLADVLQGIVERNPQLAMRQRLTFMLSSLEAKDLLERYGHQWGLAAVLTLYPDGFIREEALVRLATEPKAFEYILNRRSDWVDEVAATAERLSQFGKGRAVPKDGLGWRAAFGRAKRRRGPGKAYMTSLISDPESRLAGIAVDPEIARLILKPYAELSSDDPLVEAGLGSHHAAIRTMVAERLRPDSEIIEWATRLMADSAPGVRIAGILIASSEDPRHALIGQARLDKNARVRAQARISYGADDHLGFYRAALPHPSAIEGIGETGKRADAQTVLPFLGAAQARMRLAAVKALAALDARETVPALKQMLGDPSARVIREVIRSLNRLNATVQPEELLPFLALPDRPMRALLQASRLMSFWNGTAFLLHYGGGAEFRESAALRLFSSTRVMSLEDLGRLQDLVVAEWGECELAERIGEIRGRYRRQG